MDFTRTAVVPKGRNKYGQYISGNNVALSTAKYTYNGNVNIGGNNGGGSGTGGGNEPVVEQPNFVIFLEKTFNTFSRMALATSAQTDSFRVLAYRNNQLAPVYIADCSRQMDDQYNVPSPSAFMDITGVTSGMSVSVSNNGTTACTINVTMTNDFTAAGGALMIPANVSTDFNVSGDNYYTWLMENEYNATKYGGQPSLFSSTLQYSFDVDSDASSASAYVLNLTNDSAGINCDSAGNVLSGATRPTCKAELWYGSEKLTSGVVFGMSTTAAAAATGVSINTSTGVLTFGSNFNFLGSTMECIISAEYSGLTLYKVMTITKQYPGADGTGATTRWVVLSHGDIKFNPNNSTLTPATITAKIMKQVNDEEPVEDTSTVLYWGWDTETPTNTGYTGTVITVIAGHDYLSVGLKNSGSTFYELETVPVMQDGVDGVDGGTGASGESAYVLQLSNQFSFVNVTSGGTVVDGQESNLSTTAALHYGSNPTSAMYSFASSYQNISINAISGVVTFSQGWGSQFTGDTMQITILASKNGVTRGEVKYNLQKNYPPATNGVDATKYWLVLSATATHVTSGGTADPSTVTAEAWQQTGGNAAVPASGYTILYGYNTTSPTTNYTGPITIDTTKKYMTLKLVVSGVQYDIQTVVILRDGDKGESVQGRDGAAIRGPYEWTGGEIRRFSSGTGPLEEDYMFKDVIFRIVNGNKVYYYCNTSYEQTATTTWNAVSSAWTQSSENYDFVAANLILANNAKINFMTGNEIYLMNSGGTVTGGARAATSQDDVIFWGGSDEPGNGKFKLLYDGTVEAMRGTFGCLTIGMDNYADEEGAALYGHINPDKYGNDYDYYLTMSPEIMEYSGVIGKGTTAETKESVVICPMAYGDTVGEVYDATFNIVMDDGSWPISDNVKHRLAFNTDGTVKAFDFTKYTQAANSGATAMPMLSGVPGVPGLSGLEFSFCTSGETWSSYFSKDGRNGTWRFMGLDTGIDYSIYPYCEVANSISSSMIPQGESYIKYMGYWVIHNNIIYNWLPIAGPNAAKKQGIIYIGI